MHIFYLTFGSNTTIHTQVALSIFSFLQEPAALSSINVVTDQPAFYNHFGKRIQVLPTTPAELKEWEGEHQFFWRVKLKAFEKICQLYNGEPVMYLDSDTILVNGLASLADTLQKGRALMHENEGPLFGKKSKTEKRMWQQLQHQQFGGLAMQPTDWMWNAGLIATPNNRQQEECRLALAICDDMCARGVTRRLVEQYAISLSLQHLYGLQEARQQVAHYWSVKELWNKSIDSFFLKAYCQQWTFDETLAQVKAHNFTALPIALRNRKTNLRLKKLADRLFPPKNPVYLHP